jgi:hypothetical protein
MWFSFEVMDKNRVERDWRRILGIGLWLCWSSIVSMVLYDSTILCIRFVRNPYRAQAWRYRRIGTKLDPTQRFGFGYAGVIGLRDLIAGLIVVMRAHNTQADSVGYSARSFKDRTVNAFFRDVRDMQERWWWLIVQGSQSAEATLVPF